MAFSRKSRNDGHSQRADDAYGCLITFADKTIAEIERRDRIGALRQIAIACKKKFIRRVGGDRLDIWYKNVCPQSFKHLEEKVIRKYCTPDDADYFLKRVEDLKAEFGITDLDRLHRGYKSCTDDLHGEFHKVYDLDVSQLIQLAQDNFQHHQYNEWKTLLNLNVELSAGANLFRDE